MVTDAVPNEAPSIISISRDRAGHYGQSLIFEDERPKVVWGKSAPDQHGSYIEMLDGPPPLPAQTPRLGTLLKGGQHPALTQNVRKLLPQLWAVVLSKALQSGIGIQGAIDADTDREAGGLIALIRVYLEANSAQAIAFWNGLDSDLETWFARLSNNDRTIAQRNIALRVHWSK